MRKLIFAATLLCCNALFAQQKTRAIDSLEKLIPSQKDSNLALTYNELTWQYRMVDRDKAIDYGNKAIVLAEKINYPKSIGQAYNDLGIIYMDLNDYDKSIESYNKSLDIRKKINDQTGIGAVYLKMGIVYQKSSKFDKALEYAQKSLDVYTALKNDNGMASSLHNIAVANQGIGNVEAALKYELRSIEIREKMKDILGLSGSYLTVGNIYFLKKDMANAKLYFEKAEVLAHQIGNPEYLATIDHNLASWYDENGPYKEGFAYIEEAYALREQMQDTKGMVSSLNMWGSLLTKGKQYPQAEQKLQLGLKLADTLESCFLEKGRIYRSLQKLYEASGDYKKANEMGKLIVTHTDSLHTGDMNKRFSEIETKYRTLEQQNQIQEQQFQITKRNYLIGGIGVLVLLILLLAYSYFRRAKLKQQAKLQQEILKQQDLATKAVLNAEENERRRIAGELHDGVGQMMSAAKMNLSAMEGDIKFSNDEQKLAYEKVVSLVDESCKEVRSVSHNMMPNALIKSGLASAVRDFIDKIDNRVIKVDLYTEGLNERIDASAEAVLYRVIQESVNNTIKHAQANHLDISLIKDIDGIAVTIEDNGKGFDTTDTSKFDGIGLKNIKTRIDYLKGEVEWNSTPGKGTMVAIHIPV